MTSLTNKNKTFPCNMSIFLGGNMKNKKVKQMICDIMNKKHEMDFWFDDGQLMYYESPRWTFEGDEYAWLYVDTVSLTANQLRGGNAN